MTIVCTGWKRLSPTMSVHDPKCSLPSETKGYCTHQMSPECLRLWRIENGLPAERPAQEVK